MANILTIPTALGPDDLDDGEQGRAATLPAPPSLTP